MSNYDVTFFDVIQAQFFKLLNFPFFLYTIFKRTIQGNKEAEFFPYLKYQLTYEIFFFNKFVPQKRGAPL